MKLSQRIALGYIRTKLKLLSTISKKNAAQKAFTLFCTPQRRHKRALPDIFKQAENLTLRIGGYQVRGWRWNHPGSRKVMIIHGFESASANFDRYVKPLTRKGYEVLAFDAPGHGYSSGKRITAPLYRDMIRAVHEAYGPVESYMAHSFGGLAVCLALEEISHTDQFRLVLIAPATETSTAISSFFRFLQLDDDTRKEFDKLIIKAGGVSPGWYSIRRAMQHIRARVQWYHDEEDDTTPVSDVLKVQADNHPNIEFIITKGLGHRRIYRENKVTRAVTAFL